jgi:hypothetical protein
MENLRQQNFILRLPDLLSYCGLVDAKIRASDKDLPVTFLVFIPQRSFLPI